MDISTYTELTGKTVANTALTNAAIRRAKAELEGLLGFTLTPSEVNENQYSEEGKTSLECACPPSDSNNLLPPDAVVYAYRLFPYNPNDKMIKVDPFTELHKVKLVKGNVTVKTFTESEIKPIFSQGLAKFLEVCWDCNWCINRCGCTDCLRLAVDATWVWPDTSLIPDELLYVWADLTTNELVYGDKKGVKSETMGPHTYVLDSSKISIDNYYKTVSKYAGPFGSAGTVKVL